MSKFPENPRSEIHTLLNWCKCILIITFHICCPIYVKFGKINLHVMPLIIYEFREIRIREGGSLLLR